MTRNTIHTLEQAATIFVISILTQFAADPLLEVDIANTKKLVVSGLMAVALFAKGKLGTKIGDDSSPAWLPKETNPLLPVEPNKQA